MRCSNRTILLAVLLTLVSAGATQGPAVCTDDCGKEEGGTACADCPFCATSPAQFLLVPVEAGTIERSSRFETLGLLRPSRTEVCEVFHVPRRRL